MFSINQTTLISESKKILNTNYDNFFDDKYYFATWFNSFGKYYLKKKIKKNNFLDQISFLKNTINYLINSRNTYEFSFLNNKEYFKYSNIVFSYNDFKNKKVHDKYFSVYPKEFKKTLWVIINTSSTYVKSFSNIVVINKVNKKINIFDFFILFINFILDFFFRNKEINNNNLFKTLEKIVHILSGKNKNLKNCYLIYEAQTYQNYIIKLMKEKFKKIKVYGYLHSCLPSLPLEFNFNRCFAPSKFIVHGNGQKKILSEIFKWPKNKILVKRSFF